MRYDYTQFSVYPGLYEPIAMVEVGIDTSLFIWGGDVLQARKTTQRWVHSVVRQLFTDASDLSLIPFSK